MLAAGSELEHARECQYVIINQEFALAAQALCGVLDAARCRFSRQAARHVSLFQSLGIPVGAGQPNR